MSAPSLGCVKTQRREFLHSLGHSRHLKHLAATFAITLNADIRLRCNICCNGPRGDIQPYVKGLDFLDKIYGKRYSNSDRNLGHQLAVSQRRMNILDR
jgi:hypothetical protein